MLLPINYQTIIMYIYTFNITYTQLDGWSSRMRFIDANAVQRDLP